MVKTVFFGTPGFAVPTLARLLASPHPVVAVVTRPDRPRGRGRRVSPSPVKSLAAEHGIPVLQPERLAADAFRQQIAAFEPDVAVVAAYGRILPDALLQTPRLGTFNVHASLLPKYRGAAPIQRAILAGETRTGVTIIRLVREMDAGPMLARRPLAIGPDATSTAVEQELAELGADLLLEAVAEIEAGTATETPQDHAAATFAPRLTRDDGRIDWSRPARALHDQVRGLHPWPHAFTYLDGARYLILRSRIPEAGAWDGAGVVAGAADPAPGRLGEASGDRLVAAAGRGSVLAITEIQPEGRRPLPARAFLAGRRWTPGLRFDPVP
ncbi:MAG: methionyl-tRNA formyltransferase [Acidobacteria bacterium]|nr:methionyl-tRNA formyltransferase [Acidobacteriota bacterium]